MATGFAEQQAAQGWGAAATGAAFGSEPPVDGFDLDTEGVDPDKVKSTLNVDKPGKYHFEIANAKNESFDFVNTNGDAASPHILCVCVVLQSVAGQSPAGSLLFHRIYLAGKTPQDATPDWIRESATNFLTGVGRLKKQGEKFIDPATGTTKIDLKTLAERLTHKQFIGNAKLEKSDDPKYPDKVEFKFGRGAFPIDAAEVADVPKNPAALELIGMGHLIKAATAPATEPAGKKPRKGKTPDSAPVAGAPAAQATAAPQTQAPHIPLPTQQSLPLPSVPGPAAAVEQAPFSTPQSPAPVAPVAAAAPADDLDGF